MINSCWHWRTFVASVEIDGRCRLPFLFRNIYTFLPDTFILVRVVVVCFVARCLKRQWSFMAISCCRWCYFLFAFLCCDQIITKNCVHVCDAMRWDKRNKRKIYKKGVKIAAPLTNQMSCLLKMTRKRFDWKKIDKMMANKMSIEIFSFVQYRRHEFISSNSLHFCFRSIFFVDDSKIDNMKWRAKFNRFSTRTNNKEFLDFYRPQRLVFMWRSFLTVLMLFSFVSNRMEFYAREL